MKDSIMIRKLKQTGICVLAIVVLCISFLSCEKKEIIDNDVVRYVAQNLSAYNIIRDNVMDTVISNLGVIYPGKNDAGVQALLKEPLNSDVEVIGKIDYNPELIKAYDSLYHSHSPIIPHKLFKIVGNGTVSIKAGETQSVNLIKIEIDKLSTLKPGSYTFVVPIAMESIAKNARLKSKLMFVRYNVLVTQINAAIFDLSGKSDVFLLNTPGVDKNIFVQTSLNRVFHQALQINVEEISTKAFIDIYNSEHNTSYEPFPQGGYTLFQSTVTVPANNKLSSQRIQIQLKDLSLFSTSKNYLLALKIKNNADRPIADPKNSIMYIRMNKNNIDLTNAILIGQKIDRIGWSIAALGYFDRLIPSNVLDGKNGTAWGSNGVLPQWFTLDMGATQTIKGFSMVPNYRFLTEDFLEMDVLSSNDGKNWEMQGKYEGVRTSAQSTADQPDIKTVKFVDPVAARHFKFIIRKTTDGRYTGMAELYGIK